MEKQNKIYIYKPSQVLLFGWLAEHSIDFGGSESARDHIATQMTMRVHQLSFLKGGVGNTDDALGS